MDTKTVFELRKSGKLIEALNMALKLYHIEPYDKWTQSALAWPLIDLCKLALTQNDLNQAQYYFNQLVSINFTSTDDIIISQIAFLKPKIDINYAKIQEAENLSKNGNHKLALSNMKAMFANNELLDVHHEAFGWVIYRYIKAEENNIPSVDIRSLMRDYMNLKNEKTSLLHSIFLNFALHFSKEHSDFNLYNFFLLWDPKNLRSEDLNESYNDGKTYPSLISRIFREFIEKKYKIDINYLLEKLPSLSSTKILDLLREPFYWNLYSADKENRKGDIWKIFEEYNLLFKNQSGSEMHSKILNSAMFSMKENEEWRFLNFFENWNPDNFIESDWKEVKKEDKVYLPLAIKALKKAFELIKTGVHYSDLDKIINVYKTALAKFPKDIWLKREYALLLAKSEATDEAIKIYKDLVLELGDQAYAWHEFALLFSDEDIDKSIGMLSKAIKLQKDESFLGSTRLDLADKLIKKNKLEEALVELNKYQEYRITNNKNVADKFNVLKVFIKDIQTQKKDNLELYNESIAVAENFAYQDISWTELVFVEKWKNNKNKEKLSFTDRSNLSLSINANRFQILKSIEVGQVIKFKLHNKLVEDKNKLHHFKQEYFPLLAENSDKPKWSCLEDIVAVVDYINIEKNIVHAISSENKEVYFPMQNLCLNKGDFINAKKFQKKIREEIRIELKDIAKIDKEEVINNFIPHLAVIDSINEDKKLFHYVVNNKIHGIIRYDETELRPNIGDFIKIRVVQKLDKKQNKLIFKVIEINTTIESTTALKKDISGLLELKFKQFGKTLEWYDIEDVLENDLKPAFGFIGDYYVSKEIIENCKIDYNCDVKAKVVFSGEKWKVYELKPVSRMQNNGQQFLSWELLKEHSIFFNQFFSTFYPFTESQIINLKNKICIGEIFDSFSYYYETHEVPSKTTFGLIFNKNINWSNELKKHFSNYRIIFNEGEISNFEHNPKLPYDVVTEFKKDMEYEIDSNFKASLCLFDKNGNFIDDEFHNSLEVEIENEEKKINANHYSYLNKEDFTDEEFLKIIANSSVGYFINSCFYDLLLKKIYDQIPDFAIEQFYD